MDDPALLQALREEPAAGIEALLRRYGPLLRYVIGGILPDPGDAEDCYSEVSLAVWQNLERYDPAVSRLSTWLTAIARNTALNHRKARQRQERRLTESGAEPVSPATPESELLRRERAERLRAAIDALGTEERRLFYRKYYYLQSTARIAAELGLSQRAAEGRLYRLRQRLRQLLGEEAL
jgi:RNA polymerase sigma factor (sigma-70 family)